MLEIDKDRLIAQLARQVEELLERVKTLEARCAYLEPMEEENKRLRAELAEYKTSKHSGNSSKPPSSDMHKPKRNESLRTSSGKNPGGQAGRKGKTLEVVANPDHVLDHKPDFCTSCGMSLSKKQMEQVSARQVVDIPPIKAEVLEHRQYACTCSCGHVTKASYPSGVNSPVSYGARITGLIGYLHARQYLPFKRMEELLKDVFGTSISEGGIHYLLGKLHTKALPVYEQIKERLLRGMLSIGADETSLRVLGENHWAWTWQSEQLTYITITDNRGMKSVNQHFPDGFSASVLVHDCWHSHLNTQALAHQLCIAHLLRDLNYLEELYADKWSTKGKAIFKEALQLKKEMSPSDYLQHHPKTRELETRMEKLLEQEICPEKQKLISFQKRLGKHKEHLFTFLKNPKVPPDNNASERAIRNIKVKQKISGGFRAPSAAQGFAMLRSIIDTAIKNQQNPLGALSAIAAYWETD